MTERGSGAERHGAFPSGRAARVQRNAVLVAITLLFLWLTVQIDFIIFAGILLAIFLGGVTEIVKSRTQLPRGISLAIVVIGIAVILAAIGWFFSAQINSQINQLAERLPFAFQRFEQMIGQVPWLQSFIQRASPGRIVSSANVNGVFGLASRTMEIPAAIVILLFTGLYAAAEPGVYARGLVRLVPPGRRQRAWDILGELQDTLWHWMMGRLFSMATIGVTTGLALWLVGVPLPAALGVLAGVLTFIPYVGTIASAVPPILLALTIDPKLVLYVILIFIGIHGLEGYILVPLVQKRAAHLPPALTLTAQALLGSIVGFLGLALATPLVAALLVLVRTIYVEDVLEKPGTRHLD